MKIIAVTLGVTLLLAGCATSHRAGIADPDEFREVARQNVIESRLPYSQVARCFEDRAALLPMSSFVADDTAQRTTYRLRGFGFTYEEISFEATDAGSRATTFLAPNLNSKWYRDFERDRGSVLAACATRAP